MTLFISSIAYYEIWMGGNILIRLQSYWLKPIWNVEPFSSHKIAVYSMLFFTSVFFWQFTGKYKQVKSKMYSRKKGFNAKRIVRFGINSLIRPAVAYLVMWVLFKLYNL